VKKVKKKRESGRKTVSNGRERGKERNEISLDVIFQRIDYYP
jgi:hypothetical protein